jgi:hypothetical protein
VTALMAPGVHDGIPEADYHADRGSLSVSGAKLLLPPSCPALFRHAMDNGQEPRRTYEFGHAAHAKVLGIGAEVEIVMKVTRDKQRVQADDYETKSAQEHRDKIRAAGKTPLLWHEVERVEGMAKALRQHPVAAALLDPAHGKPEQSLYWDDPTFPVTRRGRLDWMRDVDEHGRLVIVDYKTAVSVEPAAISKACAAYGYDMQSVWYSDMVEGLGLAREAPFRFVFQMKTAPYLVTVVELDDEALRIGRLKNTEALRLYKECTRTGIWPGYAEDVELISLPMWATYDYEMDVI